MMPFTQKTNSVETQILQEAINLQENKEMVINDFILKLLVDKVLTLDKITIITWCIPYLSPTTCLQVILLIKELIKTTNRDESLETAKLIFQAWNFFKALRKQCTAEQAEFILPLILSDLTDKAYQINAIKCLGAFYSKLRESNQQIVFTTLIKLLQKGSPSIRHWALKQLVKCKQFNNKELIDSHYLLLKEELKQISWDIRYCAIDSFKALIPYLMNEQLLELKSLIQQRLTDEDKDVCWQAEEWLQTFVEELNEDQIGPIYTGCLRDLADEKGLIRFNALEQLARLQPRLNDEQTSQAIKNILPCIKGGGIVVVQAAMVTLKHYLTFLSPAQNEEVKKALLYRLTQDYPAKENSNSFVKKYIRERLACKYNSSTFYNNLANFLSLLNLPFSESESLNLVQSLIDKYKAYCLVDLPKHHLSEAAIQLAIDYMLGRLSYIKGGKLILAQDITYNDVIQKLWDELTDIFNNLIQLVEHLTLQQKNDVQNFILIYTAQNKFSFICNQAVIKAIPYFLPSETISEMYLEIIKEIRHNRFASKFERLINLINHLVAQLSADNIKELTLFLKEKAENFSKDLSCNKEEQKIAVLSLQRLLPTVALRLNEDEKKELVLTILKKDIPENIRLSLESQFASLCFSTADINVKNYFLQLAKQLYQQQDCKMPASSTAYSSHGQHTFWQTEFKHMDIDLYKGVNLNKN